MIWTILGYCAIALLITFSCMIWSRYVEADHEVPLYVLPALTGLFWPVGLPIMAICLLLSAMNGAATSIGTKLRNKR